MKIHEYQAKELLRKFQVPVPEGAVAGTAAQARQVAENLPGGPFVVKAQIHAGGRGKGGGIKAAATAQEVEQMAGQILGMTLITPQTGPEGKLVNQVLVEQARDRPGTVPGDRSGPHPGPSGDHDERRRRHGD